MIGLSISNRCGQRKLQRTRAPQSPPPRCYSALGGGEEVGGGGDGNARGWQGGGRGRVWERGG